MLECWRVGDFYMIVGYTTVAERYIYLYIRCWWLIVGELNGFGVEIGL